MDREKDQGMKSIRVSAAAIHRDGKIFATQRGYGASLIEGRLTLLEHEDAKWVSLDDIDALDWLPADWSVIEEIKRHFRNSL